MSHKDLLDSVSRNEGFRASPYLDTENLWTIAKGRCLETNPLSSAEWKYLLDHRLMTLSITLAGADWLMVRQLEAIEKECAHVFDFWGELDEVRREALIEMGYQMGIERLLGFRKMLAAVRAKNWPVVNAEAMDSRWAKQTPKRARELAEQLASGAR
jgi:lysozyme